MLLIIRHTSVMWFTNLQFSFLRFMFHIHYHLIMITAKTLFCTQEIEAELTRTYRQCWQSARQPHNSKFSHSDEQIQLSDSFTESAFKCSHENDEFRIISLLTHKSSSSSSSNRWNLFVNSCISQRSQYVRIKRIESIRRKISFPVRQKSCWLHICNVCNNISFRFVSFRSFFFCSTNFNTDLLSPF